MYLFTSSELEHMTIDELDSLCGAAAALWNAASDDDNKIMRQAFFKEYLLILAALQTAEKLNGSMLYRPMLEPLSDEDFDAAYHIRGNLSAQLDRACGHLERMRQAYGKQTRPAVLASFKAALEDNKQEMRVKGCTSDSLWHRDELLIAIRRIESEE